MEKAALAVTIDDRLADLSRPIEQDARLAIVTARDDAALELIRHDAAHIMARAVQELWPDTKVTIGPVIENGWYYDFDRPEPFTPEDLEAIEARMRQIIAARDPVRTEVWDRDRAIRHYEASGEPYKVELVEAIPAADPIRMYWHGPWQDLCRGPHLAHTGQVPADAFKLMSIAGAYWRGDSRRPMLQRIYGVAFRTRDDLKAYLHQLEEAAKRDHRKLAREMDLFHLQQEAQGSVFWHPNGFTLWRMLEAYIRRQLDADGYVEVKTPQLLDSRLWRQSGHWGKFRENMFVVPDEIPSVEDEEADPVLSAEAHLLALKPMNCPGHIQIFKQGTKSYRDLPLADGRVRLLPPQRGARRAARADAGAADDPGRRPHLLPRGPDLRGDPPLPRSLRPGLRRHGHDRHRLQARRPGPTCAPATTRPGTAPRTALAEALRANGLEFDLAPGEGAFYGPKLEFHLTDAIGRTWQCGTFQLDYVLPERLDATYVGEDGGRHRPVMLHRAVFGSFERFIGVLIEHYAGKFPLWLAPRQVVVAPIVSDANGYGEEAVAALRAAGLRAEGDFRNEKINYKVREHSLAKVPVILAVGHREIEERTVSLRRLGEKESRVAPLDAVVAGAGRGGDAAGPARLNPPTSFGPSETRARRDATTSARAGSRCWFRR